MNWIDFFTDPIFRAPTWGTLFMCISSSLMGVILFLKKKSLLAESLSHATYPGVVIAMMLFTLLFPGKEEWLFIAIFIGAFFSSWLALQAIRFLQEKQRLHSDVVLCVVLSSFFGIGVLFTSWMQATIPAWKNQMQMLLFGQAATMTDLHIALYGSLAFLCVLFFVLCFYPIQAFSFDRSFAQIVGIRVSFFEKLFFSLVLLSLVLGIRSVGVVLMSGMVVAPAVAARQFTNRLGSMFLLAAFFGALSGFLGNVCSVFGSIALSTEDHRLTLPTGPMIVLVGGLIAVFSLAFAPKRGWVFRKMRIGSFSLKRLEENLLKMMWKRKEQGIKRGQFTSQLGISTLSLSLVLFRLRSQGWVLKKDSLYELTFDGRQRASFIVRLHRLWELYLTNLLKLESTKVHKTAEEMEHILTPDLEMRLTELLSNPIEDPHQQPIPKKGEVG